MAKQLTKKDLLLHMQHTIIPFHVQGVKARLSALDLAAKRDLFTPVEIHIAGAEPEVRHELLLGYAQPIWCMGAIHSRFLLEFMGLKSKGSPSRLETITEKERRSSDIGIECFQRADDTFLRKLDPSIVELVPDPETVRRAWIGTCDFAGQRLAHATDDYKLQNGDVTEMLRRTFETIPDLVSYCFHSKL
ncbi:hypothetical protein Bsp3421_003373 [Burkholderia sp. FERM BP-3421]|uniref:hypothetical protein n=1 Tax=Burkholderia sp. FERM BP-3421 TaxID=1494466 RepID=UPI00235DD7C2|nr:hypothetical protein [Burkholderia sp. FERM BP-3421]WDD93302.1 hypothetical protein Bsp3421_003373 [Burkholderia sp. FERM BP-3421]